MVGDYISEKMGGKMTRIDKESALVSLTNYVSPVYAILWEAGVGRY